MRVVWGRVVAVTAQRAGLQRLSVEVCAPAVGAGDAGLVPADDCLADSCDPAPAGPAVAARGAHGRGPAGAPLRRAVCYPHLTGAARAGDEVALNTTACDLGLGTGGWDVVCAVLPAAPRPPRGVADACPARAGFPAAPGAALPRTGGPGRIMKLRYTPVQVDVACVEEQGAPLHDRLRAASSCGGMPVVCCELHSQAMAACVTAAWGDEAAPGRAIRVAYVMTDEAALDLHLSELCASLVRDGAVWTTITCGQATGGAHEAVTLHSALLAARALGADVAVVSQGPGIVGTATAFGTTAVAQGEAVNACASVRARAVAPLRVSFADARPRHRGLSHHSAVALGSVCLAPALVAMPEPCPALTPERLVEVDSQARDAGIWARHERVDVRVGDAALGRVARTGMTTMGRPVEDDPEFFAFAAAAGLLARSLALPGAPDGGRGESS